MSLNVKILNHTPDPEKLIATAAKLCYSSSNIEDLFEKQTEDKVVDFIQRLSNMGHESPLEHISFTFGIEGVSRALTHQLVRHRLASYSQQSQRYVKAIQFEYIIPLAIERNERLKSIYIGSMEYDQIAYDQIVDGLIMDQLIDFWACEGVPAKKVISSGINQFDLFRISYKEAANKMEKKAIEDARYVLPNACETKIMVTMNARTLLNFFDKRSCNRAQEEIRNLSDEMMRLVIEIAPNIFKRSGPSCVRGKCKEGTMACGSPRGYLNRL